MISTFPSKLPESKNAQEQSKVLPEWETKPEEKTGRWGRCVHFIVCSDREDREIGGCGVDGVCGMCVCVSVSESSEGGMSGGPLGSVDMSS